MNIWLPQALLEECGMKKWRVLPIGRHKSRHCASRLPHAYRFKEQGPLSADIIHHIHDGNTHFFFVKVKTHDFTTVGGRLVHQGNHEADRATKDAALSDSPAASFPDQDDQGVFGIWRFQRPPA